MYYPKFRRYCLLSDTMYDTIDCEGDILRQLDGDNDQVYMMYIGHKDKNGKEIFIGDILATSNDNEEFDTWDKEENGYTVVQPTNDLGYTFSKWSLDNSEDSIYNSKFVEIIGNIYENPELV